ncbi:MAG TPA: DUF1289 domain-containing protein [Xanthobacteraceae bacterium]|jgi:hypothetical protein|nr:DUF1289 domain-containing protein [Xanthobacteraceae bacterium]
MPKAIASPCINICTLDQKSGLCMGCKRTVEEIARWTSYSDAERAALMKSLPARGFAAPKITL